MAYHEKLANGYVIGSAFTGSWDELEPTSPQIENLCSICANLTSAKARICKAFPDGIPKKFWSGEADHTVPVSGDNGITFEPQS